MQHGHLQRVPPGHAVGDALVADEFVEVVVVFVLLLDIFLLLLTTQPFAVAALTPFGEVLLGDGVALEVFAQDGFDGGLVVEPLDEVGAKFAVFEAEVEFVANGFGEAGDFTGAAHGATSGLIVILFFIVGEFTPGRRVSRSSGRPFSKAEILLRRAELARGGSSALKIERVELSRTSEGEQKQLIMPQKTTVFSVNTYFVRLQIAFENHALA
jgi:hypothetical protein